MKNHKCLLGILYTLLSIVQVFSAPADSTVSLVVSSTEASNGKEGNLQEPPVENVKVPKIYQMHINSNISNRFAHTTITSKVRNIATEAQEATFSVVLPAGAFISGFIMEVDGKNYTAYVKEKEEAKKNYDEAVASGLGAAHVAVSARDSNKFTVSVNIEPQTKAAFYLTYEELLKRTNGRYEHIMNIHPGQPIKDLTVKVFISEKRKITDLKAPPLRSGNEIGNENEELDPRADIEILSDSSALVKFAPNEERQKQLAHLLKTDENDGLSGQFVVQYDVERDPKGGEVLIHDDYFVHFFAPTDLEPLPKHVVFVLDTSGSMWGNKINQLKEAMEKILDELHEKDLLTLVEFNSNVRVWNLDNPTESVWYPSQDNYFEPQDSNSSVALSDVSFPMAYPATEDYIAKAKSSVNQFMSDGGTNILTSLEVGLRLVELARQNKIDSVDRQPLVIFLTDGSPNIRDSSPESITKKVTELNSGLRKSPIFSLSFGYGADKNFLQKLSLRNMGFAKHIYEAADAALQLQDFYNQISSPLLADVTFKYDASVTEVSNTHFPILYHGAELVVTGFYEPAKPFHPPTIDGKSSNGLLTLTPVVEHTVTDIERLWAYLTVKQLLEKKDISDDNIEEIKKKALDLCLKYSFVTPLSSLVVVKPNATNAVDTEDADGSGAPHRLGHFGAQSNRSPGLTLIAGRLPQSPQYITTPFNYPLPRPSVRPVQKTEFLNLDDHPEIAIPWLNSILNSNGTLSLPAGNYKLGLNEKISVNPSCPNALSNVPGKCTLLKGCPGAYPLLTSVDVLVQHFCLLENEYAGICCPEAMVRSY